MSKVSTQKQSPPRIYNTQLKQSLLLLSKKKSLSENRKQLKAHLPSIQIQQKSYSDKQQKMLSLQNKNLRYLFHQFCKQSYVGGANATFDQIMQSAQFMTLNKWMVFCREFQLTSKLPKIQIIKIFKMSTEQRPEMNIYEFCKALKTIQRQSNINPEVLATNFLHVDSHQSAYSRLSVMKVNFSGPKANFFEQSTLTEKQRDYQKKKGKQFKQRRRQQILHQGMFKEHIELSLLQRKVKRDERSQRLRNHSAIYNQSLKLNDQAQMNTNRNKSRTNHQSQNKSMINSKSLFSKYSKIFQIKRLNMSNSHKNDSKLDTQRKGNQIIQTNRTNTQQIRKLSEENINKNYFSQEVTQQQKWQIDSDAQSDQILKSHYKREKIVKNGQNNQNQQQKYRQRQFVAEEQDNDLMITRYN